MMTFLLFKKNAWCLLSSDMATSPDNIVELTPSRLMDHRVTALIEILPGAYIKYTVCQGTRATHETAEWTGYCIFPGTCLL